MENRYSQDVWEDYYKNEKKIHIKPRAAKGGFFQSYDLYRCDAIFEKYLPVNAGKKEDVKICEIGFGDGKLLKKIADRFNYDPWGIEYSKEAVQTAEKEVHGILGDIFDETLANQYKEKFDIVFSYGFIEHIIPPEKAVQAHLNVLKPGGLLVLQIPRFKKFNWLKAKLFRPDLLPLHNLTIMEQEALSDLGKKADLQEVFCSNYGTLKLRLPMAKKDAWYYALKTICLLEYIFNPLLRLIFGKQGLETRLFSPAVMYIGKKLL